MQEKSDSNVHLNMNWKYKQELMMYVICFFLNSANGKA